KGKRGEFKEIVWPNNLNKITINSEIFNYNRIDSPLSDSEFSGFDSDTEELSSSPSSSTDSLTSFRESVNNLNGEKEWKIKILNIENKIKN
ncbi:hypothetical protein Mgra_00003416, partial [Meloidogyne graminicola]